MSFFYLFLSILYTCINGTKWFSVIGERFGVPMNVCQIRKTTTDLSKLNLTGIDSDSIPPLVTFSSWRLSCANDKVILQIFNADNCDGVPSKSKIFDRDPEKLKWHNVTYDCDDVQGTQEGYVKVELIKSKSQKRCEVDEDGDFEEIAYTTGVCIDRYGDGSEYWRYTCDSTTIYISKHYGILIIYFHGYILSILQYIVSILYYIYIQIHCALMIQLKMFRDKNV